MNGAARDAASVDLEADRLLRALKVDAGTIGLAVPENEAEARRWSDQLDAYAADHPEFAALPEEIEPREAPGSASELVFDHAAYRLAQFDMDRRMPPTRSDHREL